MVYLESVHVILITLNFYIERKGHSIIAEIIIFI